MKLVEYLSRQSCWLLGIIGVGSALCIGALDYATGPRMTLLVFYLAPVCFSSWFAGWRWGIAVACAGTTAWVTAQLLDPSPAYHGLVLVWNSLVGFSVFTFAAVLTSRVAERQRMEIAMLLKHKGLEERVQERAAELAQANAILKAEVEERTQAQAKLKLLNETLEQRVAERSAAAMDRAQELVRSETALRHQTGILQSILNSMGDGVVVADAKAKIVLMNPAAEVLLRKGMGSIGTEWLNQREHGWPDTVTTYPVSESPVLRAVRGEVFDGVELYLRTEANLEGVWLSITGRPLIDEDGVPQGSVIVFRDITPRKLMEKQITEVSDREQCRIGQDLHDGLCQQLVSTAFATELLREKLASKELPEAQRAETIADMINQAITQARQLARGLYPVRLEIDGLASALEEMADGVQNLNDVACEFSCEGPVVIGDYVAGSNLYRIAQEAVTNAVKHGRCKKIVVSLDAVEDEITLMIKDDGAGLPEAPHKNGGMGLYIMNYRAQMIGASLTIQPRTGGGTAVICSFRNQNSVIEPQDK